MANHKSAIKRHRRSLKLRDRNRNTKATFRTAVKEVQAALAAGKNTEAQAGLRAAERLIAKAAAKGIIHKSNAARRISRLATLVAAKTRTGASTSSSAAPAAKSTSSKSKKA